MKVMLVDDDPFVLNLIHRQLEGLGCAEVVDCREAEVAERYLESGLGEVDLVLCDLQMPGYDGIEFIRSLASLGFGGRLALLSGEDERTLLAAEHLARAYRLDTIGTLKKPVSSQRLGELLQIVARPRPSEAEAGVSGYPVDDMFIAIAEEQLVNRYQPIVNARNGAVEGFEALVRWEHPADGLLLPEQFMPAFERQQLIDDLLRMVLSNGLRDARNWRRRGVALPLSVNVSPANLEVLGFPDYIDHHVERAGLPANALAFEVCERSLLRVPTFALDVLTRLRLKRFPVAIDDFSGTPEALEQLRGLPADQIKLAPQLVHGVGDDPIRRSRCAASVELARQLGVRTVAKGVEDEADWDWVQTSGCDLAQGMFIGAPLAASAIPDWLREWDICRKFLYA